MGSGWFKLCRIFGPNRYSQTPRRHQSVTPSDVIPPEVPAAGDVWNLLNLGAANGFFFVRRSAASSARPCRITGGCARASALHVMVGGDDREARLHHAAPLPISDIPSPEGLPCAPALMPIRPAAGCRGGSLSHPMARACSAQNESGRIPLARSMSESIGIVSLWGAENDGKGLFCGHA
jgi:hypothetical protein